MLCEPQSTSHKAHALVRFAAAWYMNTIVRTGGCSDALGSLPACLALVQHPSGAPPCIPALGVNHLGCSPTADLCGAGLCSHVGCIGAGAGDLAGAAGAHGCRAGQRASACARERGCNRRQEAAASRPGAALPEKVALTVLSGGAVGGPLSMSWHEAMKLRKPLPMGWPRSGSCALGSDRHGQGGSARW